MTKVLAGLQYVRTLEDLYREGDPSMGRIKFDNTAGIRTMNSVFYRRNQEEMDDSADALLLAQYKTLQHRRMAGNTGMSEDQARMLEDRKRPRTIMPDASAASRPARDYVDKDLDESMSPADPSGRRLPRPGRRTPRS